MSFLIESVSLIRAYRRDVASDVSAIIARLEDMEARLQHRYGVELRGLRMLDVGAGQRLVQMTYFGVKGNDVVGIDRDVIAQGWDAGAYLRMLRENGAKRVLKTVGRKALGADRRYATELRRQLRARAAPVLSVYQMDAGAMTFPDASFDSVYSLAVFMHVDDPGAAISEVARVLRPGGVAYVELVPFTAHIGALDIRGIGGIDTDVPHWAHLRPHHEGRVRQSAFLNRVPLREWERLFAKHMTGCEFIRTQPEREQLEPEAQGLRQAGELSGYEIEELVTSVLTILWKKPG